MNKAIETKSIELLRELVEQTDEDCPQEYRSRHLKEILWEAREFLKEER